MRRQFDGLSSLVTHALGQNVLSGDYFVFVNRARTLCKILAWETGGFVIWAKRLERGRFQLPPADGRSLSTEVDALTLALILGGIDLATAKRRKRYRLADAVAATTSSDALSSTTSATICLQRVN
jgi:transposase